MLQSLFYIFIFPGLIFLFVLGLIAEYYDRKLHARLQSRVGPPFFQPLADVIKLLGKAEVLPEEADMPTYKLAPIIAMAASATAILYIPLWKMTALFSFNGDLIVVLYLLTIPSLAFFLGGWYSRSIYSMLGAVRALIQLFAYEIPLFLAILAPALLANTWSLSDMAKFYTIHPGYWFFNIIGFVVTLVAILGKLEKVPFDLPEAETEIVAGAFTEYSGRRLAILRTAMNIELIVLSSLLAAVFLPWGLTVGGILGGLIYLFKVFLVITFVTFSRTLFARFRVDQMIEFCWKYVAPFAFLQVIIDLVVKGVLLK
jgi:NADH-quinone oxidoreductase subunit H